MNIVKVKHWNEIPKRYTGIVEWENGNQEWHKNGLLHREDGPARIRNDGYKSWWLDGKPISEPAPLTEANSVPMSSAGNAHAQPAKKEEKKTMTSNANKVKEIVLSDAAIVAQRIAVNKIATLIKNTLISLVTAGKKGKQKTAAKNQIEEFLKTEVGLAAIKFISGLALPKIADVMQKHGMLKPQHTAIVEMLSNELRIQGETEGVLQFIDAISPMISMITSGLTSQLETIFGSVGSTETLRIDIGSSSFKPEHSEEENSFVASNKFSAS